MPGRHGTRAAPLIAAIALATSTSTACEPGDEVAVEAAIARVEAAVIHSDHQGLFNLHVESRHLGVVCEPRFKALFTKASERATPQTCRGARAIEDFTAQHPEGLDEEAALLVDMLDFHCRRPGDPCEDFAEDLFIRRAERSRLFQRRVTAITPSQVSVDRDSAVAYVTITYVNPTEPDKIALRLRRVDEQWLLTSYPW